MISFEQFSRETTGPATRENYEALVRMATGFECDDAETYAEVTEKCRASMELVAYEYLEYLEAVHFSEGQQNDGDTG